MRILLITIILACASVQQLAAEVVAIVHKDCADASISASDLKQMYLGKKSSWSDGTRVVLHTHDDNDTAEAFLKTYVGKTPSQFKAYWKKMVFTGKGSMPDKHKDDAAVIKAVAAQKGSIGFVDKSSTVNATDVKVLTIN